MFIVKSIITFTLARLGRNQEINGMNTFLVFPGYECHLGIPRLASGDGVRIVVH